MSGATSLSVGTFGWFAEGGTSTPPATAPTAHCSSVDVGTFSVTVDSVSGDVGTLIYLQTRAYSSADAWTTRASGAAAIGLVLTASGLTSAQLEWRVIEGLDETTFADGTHGVVTPIDQGTVQVQWYMKQTAVYWAIQDSPTSSGNPQWAVPVEIRCRWEEKTDVGMVRYRDEEVIRSQSDIYVDRDMRIGDFLYLGSLASNTPSDPRDTSSWEVIAFDKNPNVKAQLFLRTSHAVPSPLAYKAEKGTGVETATYYRSTGVSVSSGGVVTVTSYSTALPVAIRGRPSADEIKEFGGRVLMEDVIWDVPKNKVVARPGLEDWIVDAQGVRWDVVAFDDNITRSWRRVFTRRTPT